MMCCVPSVHEFDKRKSGPSDVSLVNKKLDLALCKMLALDQQLEKADAVNKS